MTKDIAERGVERGQAGQSLAELSIVLVLFLVVTFGIVDAGRLIFAYNAVSSSAREGVRYASVRGSSSDLIASGTDPTPDIKDYAKSKTVGVPVNVSVAWDDPTHSPGTAVAVTVQSTFTPVTPFLSRTINLASSTKMLISR